MNALTRNTLLGIFLASGLLCAAGLSAPHVSLGDEVHHYRFAKDNFLVHGRAQFDAAYGTGLRPGYYYNTEPLWPLALSILWRLTGAVSFPLAQIYQTFFFLTLLLATALLASRKYGPEAGFWSVMILASVPMIVSFGLLFYLDVPSTALILLTLLLLDKKKIFTAGLLFAAAVLTKRSMIFFCPVLFLTVSSQKSISWFRKIAESILLFIPAMIALLWDSIWRGTYLNQGTASQLPSFFKGLKMLTAEVQAQTLERFLAFQTRGVDLTNKVNPTHVTEYAVSNMFSILDILKYFGPVILVFFILYFLMRRIEKKDFLGWFAVACYLCGVFVLHLIPDVRYLLPIAPFLAIFSAKALSQLRSKWITGGILLLCLLQFCAAGFYTRQQRVISPGLQEGFSYIRTHLPEKAIFLYPETNFVEFTDRPMIWSLSPLRAIFWGSLEEKMKALDYAKVDYIAVKKARIYDDFNTDNFHTGAYPKSFVEGLPNLPLVKKEWENSQMSLWKVTLEEK